MATLRALGGFVALAFLNFNVSTCRSPGEGGKDPGADATPSPPVVDLSGIDTSELTAREKKEWSKQVSELLAPCPDVPVSLAQCVREKRKCDGCVPAAELLRRLVQRGKTRTEAEAAFRARFAPDKVKPIELGGSPTLGAADAPVVVVEWADFECPFCARANPILKGLVERYPETVKLVFKHYPLSRHEHAEKAARAASAAQKQGKFWEMHSILFDNQQELQEQNLPRYATEAGLDLKKFAEDIVSEEVADAVNADRKAGDKVGLDSTPTLYINGRHFDLELFSLLDDLDEWVELEAQLRTGKRPKPKKAAPKKKDAAAQSGDASAEKKDADAPQEKAGDDSEKKAEPKKKAP